MAVGDEPRLAAGFETDGAAEASAGPDLFAHRHRRK
jgi:hypothetical protein